MATSSGKKLVRSKSGLRIVSCQENNRCPFELTEPPWIRDSECFQCMHCHVRFDFMKRRHHCRRCGRIFCSTCCKEKFALPRMCFVDPVRLCTSCAEVTRKENEFYEKHLKTLMNGATFLVTSNQMPADNENNTFHCKLSADHRYILFENNISECNHEAVEFASIQNVRVLRASEEFQDNSATGLHVFYDVSKDEVGEVTLMINPASNNKVQATAWIAAVLKAVKMMFEVRGPTSP